MGPRPSQSPEFKQYYQDNVQAAFAAAARRVGPNEAEDIVAEAFAIAWRKRPQFSDSARGRAWLLTTVINLCRNQLRSQTRDRERAQALSNETVIRLQEGSQETPSAYDAAWCSLSAEDRELLGIVYHDDLTVAETASVLGISEQAARTRLSRARARFRTAFINTQPQLIAHAKEA